MHISVIAAAGKESGQCNFYCAPPPAHGQGHARSRIPHTVHIDHARIPFRPLFPRATARPRRTSPGVPQRATCATLYLRSLSAYQVTEQVTAVSSIAKMAIQIKTMT